MKVSSTIGFERAHNALLAEADEARFVDGRARPARPAAAELPARSSTSTAGPLRDRRASTRRRSRRASSSGRQRAGALVVDVRTDLQFDDAHIPGAHLRHRRCAAGFGTQAGVDRRPRPATSCSSAATTPTRARAADLAPAVGDPQRRRLPRGRDDELARGERRAGSGVERIDVAGCTSVVADGAGSQVLDVRERAEWDGGPHPRLGPRALPRRPRRARTGSTRQRPIAAICASGQRSAVAAACCSATAPSASLHVADGGVGTWAAAGLADRALYPASVGRNGGGRDLDHAVEAVERRGQAVDRRLAADLEHDCYGRNAGDPGPLEVLRPDADDREPAAGALAEDLAEDPAPVPLGHWKDTAAAVRSCSRLNDDALPGTGPGRASRCFRRMPRGLAADAERPCASPCRGGCGPFRRGPR